MQALPPSPFQEGDPVEVQAQVASPWLPALVSKRIWDNNYLVRYSLPASTTSSASGTTTASDIVHLRHIRPPPRRTSAVAFRLNDAVEAFHDGAWCPGTVRTISHGPPRKYAVHLPALGKAMEFEQLHLRPSFDWVHGRWLPSPSSKVSVASLLFSSLV